METQELNFKFQIDGALQYVMAVKKLETLRATSYTIAFITTLYEGLNSFFKVPK